MTNTSKYYLDVEGLKALINKIVANDNVEKTARRAQTGMNGDVYSAGTATTGATDYLAQASSLQDADRKLNDAISTINAQVSSNTYKIVAAQQGDAGYDPTSYAGQYKLVLGDNTPITGSALINVPKDQFLKGVQYFAASTDVPAGVTIPTNQDFPCLYFEWELSDATINPTWVSVQDLAVETIVAEDSDYLSIGTPTISGQSKTYTVSTTTALDNALKAGLTSVTGATGATDGATNYVKVNTTTSASKANGTAASYEVTSTAALDTALSNAKTTVTTKARGTETTSDSDDFIVVSKTTGNGATADNYSIATQGIKDAIETAVANKNVDAEGDAYVGASASGNKVTVTTSVGTVTGTKGTAGVYDATTGAQTTAPSHGTLSGTTNKLMDAADAMSKVKNYVDGEVAIEAARIDAKIKSLDATERGHLDSSDAVTTGNHVGVKVVEADGVITGVTVVESDIASAADVSQIRTELGTAPSPQTNTIYERISAVESTQATSDRVVNGNEITWTNDSTNHTNTPVLHVDGTTIVSSTVSGQTYKELKSGLALDYEAAVTEGNNQHAARIVLTDNQGTVLSSVNASEILGSGVVKSSDYDSSTGKLSITFVGNDTPVKIDLTELIDYNDVSVESGSTNYLQVTGTTTEGDTQLQYGAKIKALADAAAGVNGTGLVDAYDAKTYINTAVARAHTTVSGGNDAVGTVNYVNVTADSFAADGHTNYAVASTQALQDALSNAKTTITPVAARTETTADDNYFIKVVKTAGSGATADSYAISTQGIKDAIGAATTTGTLAYNANGTNDATLTATAKGLATASNVATEVTSFVNERISEEVAKLDGAAEAGSTGAVTPTYSGTNSDEFYVLQKVGEENGVVQACAASGTYASKSIKLKKVAATGAAEDVAIADSGNLYTATNVEAALAEVAGAVNAISSPSVDWVNDYFDETVANNTSGAAHTAADPSSYAHSNG